MKDDPKRMVIDGEPVDVDCTDLAALVAARGHAPVSVATAVNGEFVAIEDRSGTRLAEGDTVDIVVPIAGG